MTDKKAETVEEFLARGGEINIIETGLSGLDMAKTYKEKVKRSTYAGYKHKSGVPITVKRR
jgi:hypothetical protein